MLALPVLTESGVDSAKSVALYDVVILGGGCAGLSLAMRLAELGSDCPRTLILEQRSHYVNDRSWCFWDDGEGRLRHLVRHRWPAMQIQAPSGSVRVECGSTPYQMISGEAFYAEALRVIAGTPQIDLEMDCSILAPAVKRDSYWRLETGEGPRLGRSVVDTRPRRVPQLGGAMLWQSFAGCEIVCDAPVFDPTCVDLMDFSESDSRGIRFDYILPVSRYRALIEATRFAPDPHQSGALQADLTRAISRRVAGAEYCVVRTESGVLPMGAPATPAMDDDSYIHAGLTSGGARPSTGYAFQRIQRWADACAKRLRDGKPPAGHAGDPPLLRAMDHLFLSVLRSRPSAAPDIFLSLFQKTETSRMIRFLSDRGTLADYAAIIAALPFAPFLKEIPRGLLHLAGRPSL